MGLIYILTNRWYQPDNLYKVGLHHGVNIDELLKQYRGRYMPEVNVIDFWEVGDCITSERFVHQQLDLDPKVERYKATEWFQGDIKDILSIVESVVMTCERDPFRVRIGDRIYPLTLLSDDALSRLILREQIDTFYPRDHPSWRRIAILLLFVRQYVQNSFNHRAQAGDRGRYVEEVATLLGYPYDENTITRIYLHVQPSLSDDEMWLIRNALGIEGDNRRELLGNMIMSSIPESEILSTMTLSQLRRMARERGIARFSLLSRDQLIERLLSDT